MTTPFTMGSDPEFILVKKASQKSKTKAGVLVPSIPYVPGTKAHPYRIRNGAIQHDNLLAEVNTDAATSPALFRIAVGSVITQLKLLLAEHNLEISEMASCYFPDEILEKFPEAMEMGCDPDYDAFNPGEANKIVLNETNYNFRTAAGHLHLGSDNIIQYREPAVLTCDYLIGLPLTLIDPDTARRTLYGKASCYRKKPYGIEYRTPSNNWTFHPKVIPLIFGSGVAVDRNPFLAMELNDIPGLSIRNVRDAINTYDKGKIYDMLTKLSSIGIESPLFEEAMLNASAKFDMKMNNDGGVRRV